MAKFDPKKADLNKDGKLSDYESNVGKKRAAAMKMGHSPKKMGHSPMKKYGDGYAMKMGSKEVNSPSAFNMKDAANMAASPMMKTDPGDTVDLSKMDRSVAMEQIKHYYPGSDPYYVYTTNRNKLGESHFGSYKGKYLPGTHDFSSSAELRDMSKMTGANIAAKQGYNLGAKRLAGVIRRARGASGLTFNESNPEYVRSFQEDKKKPKGISYGHLDAKAREMFKNARGGAGQVKKSADHAKNLEYFMKLEFEGIQHKVKTKGPTFNKLKGNVLTSLPAGVPKMNLNKPKKRKGKTGVGKLLGNIGDAVSDIHISLPKKKSRPGFSNTGIPALNTRKRQRKLSRRR